MDFMQVLGIIDSKQLDVFIYIAENTNPSTNMFIGTYKMIHNDTGISEPTIAKLMKKLQSKNFIKKKFNGCWAVNPDILMKGNDQKRQILLSYYNEQEPNNSIELNRSLREPYEEEGIREADTNLIEVVSDDV